VSSLSLRSALVAIGAGLAFTACGAAHEAPRTSSTTPVTSAAPSASAAASADPLGPKPVLSTPTPFVLPVPKTFTATNGINVWLLERHALPIVAVTVVVPSGSASDPTGEAGLASTTANMLDEGAGKLGPIELARAIDTLGAQLTTGADADKSYAALTVLKRNLTPAFALLADVVARPKMDPAEWKRVHDLWLNDLVARKSDPSAVSAVATAASLFGSEAPYGHPVSGTIATAKKVSLESVKKFYAASWRADRATVVVVGDVTQNEVTALLDASLGDWKPPATPAPAATEPPAPAGPWPRAVVVDRPDAPQSVIALVRPGVTAKDPDAAALGRVNVAIGGSFTSRLNQDLREEHGWSYGARSRVANTRSVGSIVASAAVFTDKTGDALKAMLADVQTFSSGGLTEAEVDKTRILARSELVEDYERVERTASRLASDAALGLGPKHQSEAAARRDAATKADLDRLAARYFDPKDAIVVIVGPYAKIAPQLQTLGFTKPERRDAEGNKLP
jgi:predicted Zn-dependent peptidase